MVSEARAEAERRYKYDRPAINRNDQNTFIAGAEWQASRPFTEEDVEAAAEALFERQSRNSWETLDPSIKAAWRTDARAALDAVTARHTKGDGA